VSFLQNHDQVGNRAFGERLSHLIAPERLALARAIFLLSPQVPLLFMGEEWEASTPFQFFVDFENDPDLAKAVREGRRGEFKRFKAFTDPEMSQRIPDPTDRSTFERSRIDWSEIERPPHRDSLAETRRLLALRHAEILPLIRSDFHGSRHTVSPEGILDVAWSFDGGTLRVLANFGESTLDADLHETDRVLWSSSVPAPSGTKLQLPPWTGIIVKRMPA
jgi:maltooligosyltrehalose trehalohydrolase